MKLCGKDCGEYEQFSGLCCLLEGHAGTCSPDQDWLSAKLKSDAPIIDAVRIFMTGCSVTADLSGSPADCEECTKAFVDAIIKRSKEESNGKP